MCEFASYTAQWSGEYDYQFAQDTLSELYGAVDSLEECIEALKVKAGHLAGKKNSYARTVLRSRFLKTAPATADDEPSVLRAEALEQRLVTVGAEREAERKKRKRWSASARGKAMRAEVERRLGRPLSDGEWSSGE